MRAELESLRNDIETEQRLQRERMHAQWSQPLEKRIESFHALGHLNVVKIDRSKNLLHFTPPAEDSAFFIAEQRVRLSQDSPRENYFPATFIGLTEHGLTIYCTHLTDAVFLSEKGWTIDEDLVDLSKFYYDAVDELAKTAHGRELVFPALFGQLDTTTDESYDDVLDAFDESPGDFDDSQQEAVATAVSTTPCHLIQGPPGTGKTHTLAKVVEQLVNQDPGARILVTGFTHRSINNALKKICDVLKSSDDPPPIVKISPHSAFDASQPFESFSSLTDSKLDRAPGPYIIGATPFALFAERLSNTHFDAAVIDETSQLPLPSALMVMLRSDRWIFFGDHQQLPPVSLLHHQSPQDASVFKKLTHQTQPDTLNISYRLNGQLVEWPSETFYGGELSSHWPDNCLSLKSQPTRFPELLDKSHSLVRKEIPDYESRSRNDKEAEEAVEMILDLLESGLRPEEIGVVTPFRAQAARVRQLLNGDRFSKRHPKLSTKITVDTVDRFQGQEREVIIVSFTAADPHFIKQLSDFLFQPQRLNVAVTRARTKVILLHSPSVYHFAERGSSAGNEAADILLGLFEAAHSR